jgi:hypothetical protein
VRLIASPSLPALAFLTASMIPWPVSQGTAAGTSLLPGRPTEMIVTRASVIR